MAQRKENLYMGEESRQQILPVRDWIDKDLKVAIMNMFKEAKETTLKEKQEDMLTVFIKERMSVKGLKL